MNDTNPTETAPPRLAGLGNRAFAAILDAYIPLPILWLIFSFEAKRADAIADDGSYSLTGGPALLGMTFMFFGWMTYAIVSEYRFGGTLGKRMLGIQARTIDGRPITLLQSIIRNVVRCVDVIGLYLVGFIFALASPQNQRIGDRAAKTAVFEVEKPDRVLALLYAIAAVVIGVLANMLILHFAQTAS